jgi:hypothetical protein
VTRKATPRPDPNAPCVAYFEMGPWPFYCALATSEAEFAAEMARIGVVEWCYLKNSSCQASTGWFALPGDAGLAIISVPLRRRGRSREQLAALVAHEALHVVQMLADRINDGERLGDEAEAHLIQHIVQECLTVLWNTGRDLRKAPPGVRAA